MAKPRFKAQQVADALINARGILKDAARELGCSRQTIYNYIDKYTTVADAYNEANERSLDFAEGKLMDAIGKGNLTAIIFYLKTKGKHRGYVERQEISADVQVSKGYVGFTPDGWDDESDD